MLTRSLPPCSRCATTCEHALGIATVEVSANGVDFSSDGRVFEFVEVVISSVEPPGGPALGGTPVTVRGSNLDVAWLGSDSFKCKCIWENIVASASILTSGSVQCTAPKMLPGSALLELDLGGSLHKAALYRYHTPPIAEVQLRCQALLHVTECSRYFVLCTFRSGSTPTMDHLLVVLWSHYLVKAF
jgi:hypothetical protein